MNIKIIIVCFFALNTSFDLIGQNLFKCDSVIETTENTIITSSRCVTFYRPYSRVIDSITWDIGNTYESLLIQVKMFKGLNYGQYIVSFFKNDSTCQTLQVAELDSNRALNGTFISFDYFGNMLLKANYSDNVLDGHIIKYRFQSELIRKNPIPIFKIDHYIKGTLIKEVEVWK